MLVASHPKQRFEVYTYVGIPVLGDLLRAFSKQYKICLQELQFMWLFVFSKFYYIRNHLSQNFYLICFRIIEFAFVFSVRRMRSECDS